MTQVGTTDFKHGDVATLIYCERDILLAHGKLWENLRLGEPVGVSYEPQECNIGVMMYRGELCFMPTSVEAYNALNMCEADKKDMRPLPFSFFSGAGMWVDIKGNVFDHLEAEEANRKEEQSPWFIHTDYSYRVGFDPAASEFNVVRYFR